MTHRFPVRGLLTVFSIAMAALFTSFVRAEPPRLRVVVEAKPGIADTAVAERLGRWLRTRLEQEGFTIALRGEPADSTLRVVVGEHELQLHATGPEPVSDSVELGNFEVMALELLHKTIAVLGRAQRGQEHSAPTAATGAVAHSPNEPPDRLEPTRVSNTHATSKTSDVSARTSLRVSRFAAGHGQMRAKSGSDVRLFPLAWSVEGGAGLEYRGSVYDPALRLSGTALSTKTPVAARAQAELTYAIFPSLAVWETKWQLGVFYRLGVYHQLVALAGVTGGAYVHYYRYAQDDQGLRLSWALSAPIELAVQSGRLSFGAGTRVGLTGEPPIHLLLGRPLWQRRRLSWGLEAFLGWTL
jgi:hypothetical protein